MSIWEIGNFRYKLEHYVINSVIYYLVGFSEEIDLRSFVVLMFGQDE